MRHTRIASVCFMVASATLLSGCGSSLSQFCRQHNNCKLNGMATSLGDGPAAALAAFARPLSQTISVSSLYIDMAGTDFGLANSGLVTLTLTNSSGTVLSTRSFQWIRSGTRLVFQDASTVQAWANTYPLATSVAYSLDNVATTPEDGQIHTIASKLTSQGTVYASSTSTFLAAMPCSTYPSPNLCRIE